MHCDKGSYDYRPAAADKSILQRDISEYDAPVERFVGVGRRALPSDVSNRVADEVRPYKS